MSDVARQIALLVLWIRRSIPESEAFEGRRDSGAQSGGRLYGVRHTTAGKAVKWQ
jgi:hypothetical protein